MNYKTGTVAMAAAILLAGCASPGIYLRSTNSPSMPAGAMPSGSSYSSAVIQADLNLGAYVGLLLFSSFLANFEHDFRYRRESAIMRNPPELAADRNIVEMDCTQPVDRPTGNLRCK